jgi:hypothetical protein
MTLHSALGLSCGPNNKSQYQPASSERLNTLRSRLGKLKLLVIDEVAMVGADLLTTFIVACKTSLENQIALEE